MSEEGTQKMSPKRLGAAAGARFKALTKSPLALRLGIALVVFVLLIGGPGYISSRPEFLQRYSKLDGSYHSWSTSVHAKVACQRCHIPPNTVAQLGYNVQMFEGFYLSIVMPGWEPKVFDKPTNEACASCHMDLRTVSPSGDLNIPHRAHVDVLRLKCTDCHKYLVHQVSPEGKHKPWMAGCLRCHDGKTAKNDCSACHTSKVEPLTHHSADWLIVHPQKAAATGGADCKKCHAWTERYCSNCHSKRPRSHGTDWRSQHGKKVATHRNCEACHAGAFCSRCHGQVPQQNFDASLKLVQ